MEESERKQQKNTNASEVETFPVPFSVGQIKENITITTNTPSQPSQEKEIINRAFKFHSQGNITEAAKNYRYFIDQGFKNHRVFSNYGVILRDLGKLKEAELSQRKAIELNPNDAMAHSNLGIIFQDLGKLQEAELSQRKAIELNPNYAEAYYNLGNILKNLGQIKKAEIYQRKAIKIKPNFAYAYSNLGIILKERGEVEEAERCQRKAIELKPDLGVAHLNLGIVLAELGKLQEAESCQRKAIALKPDMAVAHLNLGIVLAELGKLQEAEIYQSKAIKIQPDLGTAYSNLGKIFQDLGKLEDAEKSYLKAIKYNNKNKLYKSNLINLLTIYKPAQTNSNEIYRVNEEFKKIKLQNKKNIKITDNDAIRIYRDGNNIYKNSNLELETNLSQIYKRNNVDLNCKRHKLIFNQHKIIPEFCFGCYKVQIEVNTVIELIKLFLVFNELKLKNNNTRKAIIELRPNISGFYKGLIYCLGFDEALKVSKKVDIQIQNKIQINLISKIKRGCSEYPLEFPEYQKIPISGIQTMDYNEKWRSIEKETDKGNKEWGRSSKSIEGFNLNDFLIMRNWIAYAQKIGDPSVNKITNEIIKGPERLKYIEKSFNLK